MSHATLLHKKSIRACKVAGWVKVMSHATLLHKKSIRACNMASIQTIFNAICCRNVLNNFEQASTSYNVVAIN